MGRTAPFVLVALIIGTTARAQGVAAGVGKPVVVVSADRNGELGRAIPFLEKQAVDRQAFAQAIERTGLAEQPPKISLTLQAERESPRPNLTPAQSGAEAKYEGAHRNGNWYRYRRVGGGRSVWGP